MTTTSAVYQRSRYWQRYRSGRCVQCGRANANTVAMRCLRCAARAAAASRQRAAARRLQAHDAPGPNQIACCGAFRAVPTIPYRLPCCGKWLALSQEATS
jgi:hypothetical protein